MVRRRRSPAPSSTSNSDGPGQQGTEEPVKSKRPANTAFRQQRLRAWQPVLTPRTIIAVWSVLGVILCAVGGILFWLSTTVQDFEIDYTDCSSQPVNGSAVNIPTSNIDYHFKTTINASDSLKPSVATWSHQQTGLKFDGNFSMFDQCVITFNIPVDMGPPVVMYYRLQNFYQNHRRYANSFDAAQLSGSAVEGGTLNASTCSQLAWDNGKPVYPCGLIANSMFNDTFTNPVLLNANDGNTNATYTMSDTNIAWASDANLYGATSYNYSDISPPPNWKRRYPNGYSSSNPPPALQTWQQFQNWMRTAATPDFSKPYQRNDTHAMQRGQYQIVITDNFNVTAFNGHKYFVLTTLCALGGRNPWVGVIFLVTGGCCVIMAIVFSVGHLFRPRKMGDHTYLSWNNAPAGGAGTATATGAEAGGQGGGASIRQRP